MSGNLRAERFWASAKKDWHVFFTGDAKRDPHATRLPLNPAALSAIDSARDEGRDVVLADSGSPELANALSKRLGTIDRIVPGTSDDAALPTTQVTPRIVLKQMRLHQWVKNVLVFLPMLADHAFSVGSILQAILAFFAFGFVASAVYVLNDLSDLDSDRRHRTKCNRPFASGALPVRFGARLMLGSLSIGFILAVIVNPPLVLALTLYFLATTAYSMKLKGLLALDIIVLSVLYTGRIAAGAVATEIVPSVWLLSFSIFLFLSLAAVKRLAELVDLHGRAGPQAASGRAYTVEDRPIVAMIATSAGFIAVLVFALYLDSPDVRAQYNVPSVLWGICLVLLFWISRIVLLAHRGLISQDPVVFALTDKVSRIALVIVVALFALASLL